MSSSESRNCIFQISLYVRQPVSDTIIGVVFNHTLAFVKVIKGDLGYLKGSWLENSTDSIKGEGISEGPKKDRL